MIKIVTIKIMKNKNYVHVNLEFLIMDNDKRSWEKKIDYHKSMQNIIVSSCLYLLSCWFVFVHIQGARRNVAVLLVAIN
jgi:hypothetical protein